MFVIMRYCRLIIGNFNTYVYIHVHVMLYLLFHSVSSKFDNFQPEHRRRVIAIGLCVCVCVSVCLFACLLPRNLGECFVSLLVKPIAGKNMNPSDKQLCQFLKDISVADKS